MTVNLWHGTHLRIVYIQTTSSKVDLKVSLIENLGTENLREDWPMA